MARLPQIPPALVGLLADLEAHPPSIQELEVDLGGDEFEGHFTSFELQDEGEGSHDGGGNGGGSFRRQVRLRVLTAIGNCRSLRVIDLNPQNKHGVYSSVTEAEATAFFEGLRSNRVLGYLKVIGWPGFGTVAACEALAGLVRSSRTLEDLDLMNTGMTAPGLGHIAAALQANSGGSGLRALYVDRNTIGDAAGAQHLADILASVPTLKALGIFDVSLDAAGGEVIAKALAHNTTLEWLSIGWYAQANSTNESAALSRILAPLSASVGGTGGGSDAAFNSHVKVLSLVVWKPETIETGLGEAVAHMLRSNVSLEHLRITTSFLGYALEALQYNTSITQLKVLHSATDKTVDLDYLIPILHNCQTVQSLELVEYDSYFPPEFKKQVLRSLKDNLVSRRW